MTTATTAKNDIAQATNDKLKVGFEATKAENEKARSNLLTSRIALLKHEPFFGNLATRLELVNADEWLPTCATDGKRFYYNTHFVNQLPPKQLMFVFAHEVLHCVYDHMARGKHHDRQLANIAADYCVNGDLVENRIGERVSLIDIIYDKKYVGWTYEDVYRDLYDNAEKIDMDQLLEGLLDEHLKGDSGGEGATPDPEGKSGPVPVSDEERESIKDAMREAMIDAAKQSQGAGNIPANVKRMIKEFTEPQIDWRDLLDAQIKSTVKSDFSFMRPNRKGWHTGAILPGMIQDEMIDAVVAIDTSGSISEKMIAEFLSEVKGIMEQYAEFSVKVFCFDTEVGGERNYTAENSYELDEYEPVGGGGTDFDAVYTYMKENDIQPNKLIMFTDGYPFGSWGDEQYCDVCYIIHTRNRDGAPVPPFGSHAYYIPGQGI